MMDGLAVVVEPSSLTPRGLLIELPPCDVCRGFVHE
jgi:hypothetical protein